MPLDGKCKEIIGKRVCAKDVTTLFYVSYYPDLEIAQNSPKTVVRMT